MLNKEFMELISEPDNTNDKANLLCSICCDKATGRHFGAISCHSCKGFFRRTIRLNYKYTCRFSGNCNVERNRRAECRACRFNRCVNSGMRAEAVQHERDSIGKRQRTHSEPGIILGGHSRSPSMSQSPRDSPMDMNSSDPFTSGYLLQSLMKSEERVNELKDVVLMKTSKLWNGPQDGHHPYGDVSNLDGIHHSLHTQLILLIEWAKTIQPFVELPTEDQIVLLKNFSSQHIVLCLAYRSKEEIDRLRMINDQIIYLKNGLDTDNDYFYKKDCALIYEQLVKPMRFMQIDEIEFVAMKACVLFNPVVKGLSDASQMKVLETRRRIFGALENYIRAKIPYDHNRIADLTFFLLSSLQALAKSISEDLYMTKIYGLVQLDLLLEELMLDDGTSEDVKPQF